MRCRSGSPGNRTARAAGAFGRRAWPRLCRRRCRTGSDCRPWMTWECEAPPSCRVPLPQGRWRRRRAPGGAVLLARCCMGSAPSSRIGDFRALPWIEPEFPGCQRDKTQGAASGLTCRVHGQGMDRARLGHRAHAQGAAVGLGRAPGRGCGPGARPMVRPWISRARPRAPCLGASATVAPRALDPAPRGFPCSCAPRCSPAPGAAPPWRARPRSGAMPGAGATTGATVARGEIPRSGNGRSTAAIKNRPGRSRGGSMSGGCVSVKEEKPRNPRGSGAGWRCRCLRRRGPSRMLPGAAGGCCWPRPPACCRGS